MAAASLADDGGLIVSPKSGRFIVTLDPRRVTQLDVTPTCDKVRYDMVNVTNGLRNDAVAATFLLIQRGTDLRGLGYFRRRVRS